MKKLNIQISYDSDNIYPINGNVVNYIEDLIINQILYKYKIIINSNWSYLLGIAYTKSDFEDIAVVDLRIVKSGMTKICTILCPIHLFKEYEKKEVIEKTLIRLLLKSVRGFFEENFKKVNLEDIDAIFDKIDFENIISMCEEKDLYPDKIFIKRGFDQSFTLTRE
jgi:hypothetical protein